MARIRLKCSDVSISSAIRSASYLLTGSKSSEKRRMLAMQVRPEVVNDVEFCAEDFAGNAVVVDVVGVRLDDPEHWLTPG